MEGLAGTAGGVLAAVVDMPAKDVCCVVVFINGDPLFEEATVVVLLSHGFGGEGIAIRF